MTFGYPTTNTLKSIPEIKEVIFNNPATIIKWKDGTKTIVKSSNQFDDGFNEEVGFSMAVMRKLFGGRNQYKKHIKNAVRQSKKVENVKIIQTFFKKKLLFFEFIILSRL